MRKQFRALAQPHARSHGKNARDAGLECLRLHNFSLAGVAGHAEHIIVVAWHDRTAIAQLALDFEIVNHMSTCGAYVNPPANAPPKRAGGPKWALRSVTTLVMCVPPSPVMVSMEKILDYCSCSVDDVPSLYRAPRASRDSTRASLMWAGGVADDSYNPTDRRFQGSTGRTPNSRS